MIFSNKIYKVSSGTNPSMFAENNNKLTLMLFKELVEEKEITFSPSIKCLNTSNNFGYSKVIKLNDQHSVICLDKCISIIDDLV